MLPPYGKGEPAPKEKVVALPPEGPARRVGGYLVATLRQRGTGSEGEGGCLAAGGTRSKSGRIPCCHLTAKGDRLRRRRWLPCRRRDPRISDSGQNPGSFSFLRLFIEYKKFMNIIIASVMRPTVFLVSVLSMLSLFAFFAGIRIT